MKTVSERNGYNQCMFAEPEQDGKTAMERNVRRRLQIA